MNFPIICFLLLVNRCVIVNPAPQLNLLENVPSATELRKTVRNPVAGDECGYGKFGGGHWAQTCPDGWIIPEWYIADLTVRCCIKTKCGINSQGFCANKFGGGCVGVFEQDPKCPGYRLNIGCCLPIPVAINPPSYLSPGGLSQTPVEEESDLEALFSPDRQQDQQNNDGFNQPVQVYKP